ncbi:hypothetical protein ABIE35_002914 [Paenarthrobacter sp. 4246]
MNTRDDAGQFLQARTGGPRAPSLGGLPPLKDTLTTKD